MLFLAVDLTPELGHIVIKLCKQHQAPAIHVWLAYIPGKDERCYEFNIEFVILTQLCHAGTVHVVVDDVEPTQAACLSTTHP